ncbi:hypothetical protein [Pseudomonas phage vB_PaeP_YL2]|uniref:Ph domain protein n=3 Tax=Litunavirus TaxID=1920762 RepID=A0A0E3XBS9_9CAUD|nr:hypothetical protein [Salmonella enterica]YP_009152503.1 hypothetical protein ACQ34_gp03 [Pseudomonas phage YH6]YP_009226112.1 ph domain protein [Pseudomonas phage YH30]YP_010658883.1 hypothetical protein PP756_gp03 [Pseudomonas phage VB_PaeP_VL1]YP_010659123.1 hypothetical protein PP758_gp61 [Pseudomonas phage PAP02]AWY02797.1 hypothetical protein [Pseudomonas phage LP14]WJY90779.1 hypothetical protein phiPA13_1 [Pseudomonas phage phiPA1-3]WJZ48931.1 hypothetical protein [Pseudomonas pha
MFKALNQFFAMLESMFRAVTNLTKAAENVTEWAEEESAHFNNKARLQREQAIALLNIENAQELQEKGLTEAVESVRKERTKAKA